VVDERLPDRSLENGRTQAEEHPCGRYRAGWQNEICLCIIGKENVQGDRERFKKGNGFGLKLGKEWI